MTWLRRVPPLLRVLGVLGMLAPVASCGVNTWAFLSWWQSGEPSRSITPVVAALVDLGLACIWPVVVYNTRLAPVRRHRHAVPWLGSWRGQLMSALVLSALPMAAVVVALLVAPSTPLFWLGYAFDILFLLLFIGTLAWVMV